MKKQNKKQSDKSQSIKRLPVDSKSSGGIDSISGVKCTPVDKNIFKKDIPEVVIKGK